MSTGRQYLLDIKGKFHLEIAALWEEGREGDDLGGRENMDVLRCVCSSKEVFRYNFKDLDSSRS